MTNKLLPFILKKVSESSLNQLPFADLCLEVRADFYDFSLGSEDVKKITRKAIQMAKDLGLLTFSNSIVRMPVNFLEVKLAAMQADVEAAENFRKRQEEREHKSGKDKSQRYHPYPSRGRGRSHKPN